VGFGFRSEIRVLERDFGDFAILLKCLYMLPAFAVNPQLSSHILISFHHNVTSNCSTLIFCLGLSFSR
jgi:hypothetical protein